MRAIIKTIKDFFSTIYVDNNFSGLLEDTRTAFEKSRDFKIDEVFSFEAPVFREVKENEWKKYQVRSQGTSGSCVANTVAKMFEVKLKNKKGLSIKFSHAPIYINRINKPGTGMVGVDALQIAINKKTCKEELVPSEYKTDKELDATVLPSNFEEINDIVSPNSYLVGSTDFDYVASLVESGEPVMIWVDSSYSKWCQDIPQIGGKGGGVRHSITVVDAVTFNGVKYLVIEDSWGKFGKYDDQRLITREFFNDAVFFVSILKLFTFDIEDKRFEKFYTQMKYMQRNDEVKRLQDFLKAKGLLAKEVPSTGYYGNITAKAVYDFQKKFNVAPLAELNTLKGRSAGPKTLIKINENI